MAKFKHRDYTPEAIVLFQRIVDRHGLEHVVGQAPVEVLWALPVQPGLTQEVTLCLQNRDELNFGVGAFWSTFFPFPDKEARFEQAVDAWIRGDARIIWRKRSQILQVLLDGSWEDVATYRNGCFGKPRSPMISNELSS